MPLLLAIQSTCPRALLQLRLELGYSLCRFARLVPRLRRLLRPSSRDTLQPFAEGAVLGAQCHEVLLLRSGGRELLFELTALRLGLLDLSSGVLNLALTQLALVRDERKHKLSEVHDFLCVALVLGLQHSSHVSASFQETLLQRGHSHAKTLHAVPSRTLGHTGFSGLQFSVPDGIDTEARLLLRRVDGGREVPHVQLPVR